MKTSRIGLLVVMLLGLTATFVPIPTIATVRLDPPSPDYLVGDLTWQSGQGGVSWRRNAASDDYVTLNSDQPAAGGYHTQYYIPYTVQETVPYYGTGGYPEGTPIEFRSAPLERDVPINGSRLVQIHLMVKAQNYVGSNGVCQ